MGVAWWLDLIILEVFSNLNDSTILGVSMVRVGWQLDIDGLGGLL